MKITLVPSAPLPIPPPTYRVELTEVEFNFLRGLGYRTLGLASTTPVGSSSAERSALVDILRQFTKVPEVAK